MYLDVHPNGGRYWRLKYRYLGKEKCISFGAYPERSLGEARKATAEARHILSQGADPSAARKAEKARAAFAAKALASASRVRVAVDLEGTGEIWKGNAVMCLTPDEARRVIELLARLLKQEVDQ